ncbi:hypothetical protein [Parvularcula dongshanensis]|uniref:Uncharacterized protein n=1 Tax=Parvularcula dongshanensis TaxID=1173995 RepID=A0A840HZD6_9PROT|nr:hypothetical protein [Parvularcula dongshanensis]MBB4658206.1 hypothetical protein [Parvularcula dongshanensis]
MANRICKHQVAFAYPFTLKGIRDEFPAGAYTVETEEAPVTGDAHRTHRAIGSILVRRHPGARRPEFWDIDLRSLASALDRDAALGDARRSGAQSVIALPMDHTMDAIGRAEDEGWPLPGAARAG